MTTLFFFIKWLTTQVLEQEAAPFLELARAKGIRPAALFWKHLIPTMIYRFYLFFRANIITVLSSLVIIEYTFEVQGMFRFVFYNGQMPILMVILFLIYLPIFIIDLLAEWLIPNAWKGDLMRRTLMRDPVFWLCLFLLTGFLLLSFGNTIFRDGQVDQISNRYAEDGTFLATSPLKPSSDQWLGTDRSGYDLFQLMIEGFKWTAGICMIVALGRMFLSLVIAIPLAFKCSRQSILKTYS